MTSSLKGKSILHSALDLHHIFVAPNEANTMLSYGLNPGPSGCLIFDHSGSMWDGCAGSDAALRLVPGLRLPAVNGVAQCLRHIWQRSARSSHE